MGNNDHDGGLIVHYLSLVKFLKSKDFDIVCININDTGKKIFENEDVIEIIIPYNPKGIIHKFIKSVKLLKCSIKVRNINPDVFIATGLGHGYNLIASQLHNHTFKIHQEVIYDAKVDSLRNKVVKNFDAVAVQTMQMVANYKKNVSREINVSYLPCFTRRMSEILGVSKRKEEGVVRLAYFGRLAHNKGLVEFIENVGSIFFNENIILDIYGKGRELNNIQSIVDKKFLNERIHLKGFYEDKDFSKLISLYDATILPSTYNEGLPLVLLESMFYSKPVFASRMGAIPELAEKNEAIFLADLEENKQKEDFTRFIKLLKNNSFDLDMIKKVYETNFSNECFEEVWLKMLKSPRDYFNLEKNE
jgi:glycosyltransferase involved in cell wall biosynthesis